MAWHPTWNDDERRSAGGRYRYIRLGAQWQGRSALTTLLVITGGVFLVVQLFGRFIALGDATLAYYGENLGALRASDIFGRLQLWRLVTFQFLHGGWQHIFWNMFGLWMFGRVVEMHIGPRRFMWLYLLSGIAGGLTECGLNYFLYSQGHVGHINVPIVGASAGVCGVLIAFAMLNPNAQILLMFIVPIRAKWFALGYAVLTTIWAWESFQIASAGQRGPTVAHAAHLGGMVCAVVWLILAGYVNRPWAYRIRSWFTPSRRRTARPVQPGPAPHRSHPVVGGPNTGGRGGPTRAEEERLDVILRKIHDSGLSSLSDEEREFLRSMSERARGDADFDNRYRRG